ncbi:unnamed protein product [Dovyalis caffra]|uniref:Pentatricopeptide repeat-containing protein n=1 Tax=Dovyalis caffra TaxID=77055 RepID=A0AAV1R7Y0_9ROSI|nr:unnamed protein product [Dovyalis caffra]
MIKWRPFYHYLYFKPKNRPITSTCAAPLDPKSIPNDHTSLCQSLVHDLLSRGLLSSAQQVIQRFIASSSTVTDAVSVIEFASRSGMDLGLGISSELVRKLVDLGEPLSAHEFYHDHVIARGIEQDSNIVNSMVVSLTKLGKLDDAVKLFDRLIGSDDCVLSNAACSVILEGFYKQDKFLEAFDYFVRISDANVKLGMWVYNVLINGLCHQGYVDEAMEVFDITCKRTGLPPTLHMFKTLFFGLCKRGWSVVAESFFEEMEAQGYFVDKVMYTSLMNAYGKDKKMKMAMRVYFRMLKTGCDPDVSTYNTLIHGFLKMGLFDKAWVLWNMMNGLGIQANEVTYNLMICNYCKQGKLDCATALLNSMIPCNLAPRVHCYTPIMAALYKQNRCLEADEFCEGMLESGIVPDHILFFVLMKNKPKGLELQLCLLMLQAIAKNGCGLDHSSLSNSNKINSTVDLEQEIELLLRDIIRSDLNLGSAAGSIYIIALCEGRKTEAALACLQKMVNAGCIPLLFTFNSFIKCLSQDGLFEDVKSLIEIMQNWGMVPNLETYLIVVNEYCKQEDLVSALHILDQMEEAGLKPNVAIYDCIIAGLSRQGRISEAETLFHRMCKNGLDPDEVVYMTMINAYARNGRGDKALRLFEMMIENTIQPSSSGLVKRKMTIQGCVYLEKMLGESFVPNIILYSSLVNHYLKMGEFKYAFRLVDLMVRSKIKADLVLHIAWIGGLFRNITGTKKRWYVTNIMSMRARELLFNLLHQKASLPSEDVFGVSEHSPGELKELALMLMRKIKRTGFMPNLYLYNVIISGFCWANMMHDAYHQFKLMQKEGLRPNEVTFTILIGAHGGAGEIDHAIGLFNRMNADGFTPDRCIHNTLLKSLCKAGRELDALSLLHTMHKRGFFPSRLAYEKLLQYFCAHYMCIPAFRIFEEMVACNLVPCLFRWNWLLYILCEEKKLHEAYRVCNVMFDRGILPDESVMRLLVKTSDEHPLLLLNGEVLSKYEQPPLSQ